MEGRRTNPCLYIVPKQANKSKTCSMFTALEDFNVGLVENQHDSACWEQLVQFHAILNNGQKRINLSVGRRRLDPSSTSKPFEEQKETSRRYLDLGICKVFYEKPAT